MIGRVARSLLFRRDRFAARLRLARLRLDHGANVRWGAGFAVGDGFRLDREGADATAVFGDGVLFRRFCTVWLGPAGRLTLGDRVFLNTGCSLTCRGRVTVGADTLFGEGVRVYDHNHKFRDPDVPVADQGYTIGEVRVGRNCWLGSGVILLKGADIGDHCVIGAGCVVAGPVPPHSIVRLDPAVTVTPMQCSSPS